MNADAGQILGQIRAQARAGHYRLTQHAQQEMVEDGISLDDLLQSVDTGEILEHYPEHKRGPCCLLNGNTDRGRPIHIVCTTEFPVLIIITVYEPKPPKWVTPTQRRLKP